MGLSAPTVIERRIVASDDLLHSHDALIEVDALIETLAKEITISQWMVETTLRVKCKYKRKLGGTACMGFYKNDVLVAGGSGVWCNATDNFVEETADLPNWFITDRLGVYGFCSGPTHIIQVKELRVYGILSYFKNSY